ncbi:hypothetical protein [Corynebacterium durum]|uniref:hypothetical protein n=1 Tax=Corynebacterium durum TaxID=61592 RepID=UPI00288A96F7|nr:hypothetical protein [Corynebacterium durum]
MISRKFMAVIVAAGMATAAGCGHEDAAHTSATAQRWQSWKDSDLTSLLVNEEDE